MHIKIFDNLCQLFSTWETLTPFTAPAEGAIRKTLLESAEKQQTLHPAENLRYPCILCSHKTSHPSSFFLPPSTVNTLYISRSKLFPQ